MFSHLNQISLCYISIYICHMFNQQRNGKIHNLATDFEFYCFRTECLSHKRQSLCKKCFHTEEAQYNILGIISSSNTLVKILETFIEVGDNHLSNLHSNTEKQLIRHPLSGIVSKCTTHLLLFNLSAGTKSLISIRLLIFTPY